MCGIAGLFTKDPTQLPDRDVIGEMLRRIRHRGPDDTGCHCSPGAGIGHNRLAIIDPAHARQPMYSEDGRHVLAFNGEIYNFLELRQRLETLGRTFRTSSDTEVLLSWLCEYGVGGLPALNGMFAFALWDTRERTALLARDRLGIKPLYWAMAGCDLAFGSEIKAMLPVLPCAQPDLAAIFEFLTFQNLFSEKTFFRSVKRLKPGSWLRFRCGDIESGSFWKLDFDENTAMGFDDAVEQYSEALQRSVRRHMIADVPLGAYLSGGLDSGQVAACASSMHPGTLQTFTGAFTDAPYYDERPLARLTAGSIGAQLHEVEITPSDYLQSISRVIWLLDEPTLGTGALPQYRVAQEVSRHVKVVLTGHGGDEMFAGYQVNKTAYFRECLSRSPLAALRVLGGVRRDELTRFLYYLVYPLIYPEVGAGMFIMTPRKKRRTFLHPDFLNTNRGYEPVSALEPLIAVPGDTPGQRLTRAYLQAYLPTLLTQEDRMSMGHSIEARTPLCDNELLDLSLRLPLQVKLHGNTLKAVPRQAARSMLPPELYSQPKRGFPTPFSRWYRGKLKSFVQETLFSHNAMNRGIFSQKGLMRCFQLNCDSKTDTLYDYARANVLWSAMAVELWFRTFMDNDGGAPLDF